MTYAVIRLPRYTKADLDEITGGIDDPFEVAAFGVRSRDKDEHFGVRHQGRLVAADGMRVEQPGAVESDHPLRTMWLPPAEDAVWPSGRARLHSLPM